MSAFGATSAFGGPCDTRTSRSSRRTVALQPLPHDRAVLAHAAGAADRPQSPLGGHGRHHRDRHLGARATPRCARTTRRRWRDAQAQRLLHGAVRQVPRGAGLADQPDGPVRQWPTGGGGFEYFYGFIGGENNQWYPALYEGTTPVEPPKTPEQGYHLTEDLTDHAITWVRQQKSLMPDKPFFMYFAPGATHAPHHVPKEWIDKYKGKFAHGWDKQREITFARQKELGVIPADAELTERHDGDPGLGRHGPGAQAGPGAPDGDLRRLHGTHRPSRRPAPRRDRRSRHHRRHADLLDHRRQRRLGRRHAAGHVQRDDQLQRHGRRSRRPSS